MKQKIRHRRDLWKVIKVKGDAAEIGVAEGYFSADILSWPNRFPKVYMVDRWCSMPDKFGDSSMPQEWHDKNLREAVQRVLAFGDRPMFLQGESALMSAMVPDKSLAFLNVDGDHIYEGVKSDIWIWIPKIVSGGVIAFHDYENTAYGVKQAVQEYIKQEGIELHLLPEDKIEDAGAYFFVP